MPVDATLNPVPTPTTGALRNEASAAFDADAFDLFAFDAIGATDDPSPATLNDAPAPTAATLEDV